MGLRGYKDGLFSSGPGKKVENIKTRGLNEIDKDSERLGNVQNVRCTLKWTFPTLSVWKTTDRELYRRTESQCRVMLFFKMDKSNSRGIYKKGCWCGE
jgi:hypothetical protein